MKLQRFFLSGLCLLLAAGASAQRVYMKVMDPAHVEGESFNQQFPRWTEIIAFNAGSVSEITTTGGGGQTIGRPETKCFTISMRQDKVAYYLKKEMYTGSNIASIQLDAVKTTGSPEPQTYYRLLMENVFVSAIEEATEEDGTSTMNVSFVPRRFRYTYWPQLINGNLGTPVIFGWDVATNQPW